jgi:hypothetical protein
MFSEIEENLAKVLREKLVDLPEENVRVDGEPSQLPAVIISKLEFEFDSNSMAENLDQGNLQIDEALDSDGVKTSFKLQEKPRQKSFSVESPPGTLLSEKDYTINFADGTISFRKAPPKGKGKIIVRYNSQRRMITLKSLKIKATYAVNVVAGNRKEADSIAEQIVKSLLTVDNQSLGEGVEIKPIGGFASSEDGGKKVKVQLKYAIETEIRVEQVIGPMEKIEITSKDILR